MAEKVRPERVAEEFREILAEEIPRLKDPRVGFVTVTRVSVSPDLRRATVFYTVLGENKDVRGTRAGLASARAFLRRTLGHQVRLKYTPELDFEHDVGPDQVERVKALLEQISTSAGASKASNTSNEETE